MIPHRLNAAAAQPPGHELIAADPEVGLDEEAHLKVAQSMVELLHDSNLATVLAADGISASEEAVAKFIEGAAGKGKTRKKLGKAAVDWLLKAVPIRQAADWQRLRDGLAAAGAPSIEAS